jgi:hypothetical protein
VAGKIAETPETSDNTSIKQRVDHVATSGQTAQLNAFACGTWSTWRVALSDEMILNRGSRRQLTGRSPCRDLGPQRLRVHVA